MGYRIISTETSTVNTATPTVLGISYKSNDTIFTPIYTTTEQALENLRTLLLTRVGERYGYPQFGTHLLNILFEPNVNELKTDINEIINSKVSHFLPYMCDTNHLTKTLLPNVLLWYPNLHQHRPAQAQPAMRKRVALQQVHQQHLNERRKVS